MRDGKDTTSITHNGWRCFQCDQVFTDRKEALGHFGLMETVPPRCCIDEERYRQLHAKLMLREMK